MSCFSGFFFSLLFKEESVEISGILHSNSRHAERLCDYDAEGVVFEIGRSEGGGEGGGEPEGGL